jgi:hypothetical protein
MLMNPPPVVHSPQTFCRAGAARGDITPPVGAYHRMWGAATHERSTGIHRPLIATVFAMQSTDGQERRVVVSLDHCILDEPELSGIRQRIEQATSFAAKDIHISLTHTHGAGLMMRDRAQLPGGDLIAPYLEEMARKVGAIARDAERSMQPAWIVHGRGRCDLAAHRDFYDAERGGFVCGFNPGAPADDTLMVARVTDEAQRTIATIVNYACHPTTLAWQNTLVSPDYLGTFRELIERATEDAPCLFLQGASGELGPREGFVGDTAVADRNGRQLAYAALSALEALPPGGTRFEYTGAVVSGAILGTWAHASISAADLAKASHWRGRTWTARLPYRTDLPTLEETRRERAKLMAEEQAIPPGSDPIRSRDVHALIEQMSRQIMRLEALPPGDAYPLPVSVWQAGDAIWVCLAGEHYSVLQRTLRSRFASPIFVSTITDGWQPGYLPTVETYGKGIYQEIIAMVAPGSLDLVIEEISAQLEQWGVARRKND